MATTASKYFKNLNFYLDHVSKRYKKFMDTMKIPTNKPLSVIDVGIGSSRAFVDALLPLLPENVSEIVVSDANEEKIECTRSILKDPRVAFEKFGIGEKNIPRHLEKRFDLLFSAYCFSYVIDLRQLFKNCGSLLKPDGQLLTIFQYQKNGLFSTYRRMSEMDKWKLYTQEYANYSASFAGAKPEVELKIILKDQGIELLRYEFEPDNHMSTTKREILDGYSHLDKNFIKIPEHEQEDYKKDFLGIFSEETGFDFLVENLDVPIQFNFPTVTVHAEKKK